MSKYLKISKVLLITVIVFISKPTWAMMASDLLNLKIIGYHFTTRITSDEKISSVKDPSKARYLVLKFSANISSSDGALFLNDFLLRYFHDNEKEDRSRAKKICSAETSMIGEEDNCLLSEGGWIKIGTGDVFFTVSFLLENEIKNIEIHRVGGAEVIHYSLSSERPYSVFVATNQGIESIADIIEVIESGGYRVLSPSNKLDDKEKGISIFYAKSAEVQAREISQRIMTKTKIAPVVNERDFSNSDSDIIIWIGK